MALTYRSRLRGTKCHSSKEHTKWHPAGLITGASGRNWSGYGDEITLPDGFDPVAQLFLSDPQTFGGLLLSCHPDQAEEAIGIFHDNGFEMSSVIGQIKPGSGLKIISRLRMRIKN